MNKKDLWQNSGIVCLIICIALFPASFIADFFNHCAAITMLFASPMFLILFVVCAFMDDITNHWDNN